jgi:hypothetical protein
MMRYCLVFMLVVSACSQSGSDVTTEDGRLPEVREGIDEIRLAETSTAETLDSFAPDQRPVDAPAIDLGNGCEAGAGCFLDPCEDGDDCLSGICVGHMGNDVCTVECVEECPQGWLCEQLGAGPDTIFACISPFTHLCRPCANNSDCVAASGIEDVCLSFGDEGSFCGADCASSGVCPEGFECVDAPTVDGGQVKNCRPPDEALCDCSEQAVKLGLTTSCRATNEFGTCQGSRQCTADGLSDCDSTTPTLESCDGQDNDCNGLVDDLDCSDDDDCTEDSCDPEQGCVHLPLTGTECGDGNVCTLADHCEEGVCVGTPISCDDNDPCTKDLCDPTGGCDYQFATAPCDDGNPCTAGDICVEGECQGTELSCDCLMDADCDTLEDGNACNGTLVCNTAKLPHVCEVEEGTVVECEAYSGENDDCLANTCDTATGECELLPANEGTACDHGNLCIVGESCLAGLCQGGVEANCNDGNTCTDDGCDPLAGCTYEANQAPCEDGNPCTLGDGCEDGECVAGPTQQCQDQNICTDDFCDPVLGCVHNPNDAPCDDGNFCTQEDFCAAASCKAGDAIDCADDNICTDDTCDPAVGCVHSLNQAPCSDGDLCTVNDLCQLGACVGGGELPCTDNDPCTEDSCVSGIGCVFNVLPDCCPDGLTSCGDDCVDLDSDSANCGECGKICEPVLNGDVNCIEKSCAIVDCTDGFGNCDGLYEGGCEANLLNDPANCNKCGIACDLDAGESCIDGECLCIPLCDGKECGDDGCNGICGTCGEGENCEDGLCTSETVGSFKVLESKAVLDSGIHYLLLKVAISSATATSDDWCQEYQLLCGHYDLVPTGCGDNFDSGGYKACKTDYLSNGIANTLGCNPSGGVAGVAKANGFPDATSSNSFGFHYCGDSCAKELCSGENCNSALSYFDADQEVGYTLCFECAAQCDGKVCGDDGCGGTCGQCAGPQDACVEGLCVCQPACDGKVCGDDGCGGSCGGCNGKVCGDDGCGGNCGQCEGPQEACDLGQCVCMPACDGKNCGPDGCGGLCGICDDQDTVCHVGECLPFKDSWVIAAEKEIIYKGLYYLLLKVGFKSETSVADNWCHEYTNLCASYGYLPTGCGDDFPNGGYGECKTKYHSDGTSNSLGCNPSGGVSNAAQQNGFPGATSANSFGYHSCGGSCQKQMCSGDHCNSALSYIDTTKDYGYTLCLMCKPDCEGKSCGDDGCGGTCGTCQGEQDLCTDGLCLCQPACDGKVCGKDGCGGSCGGCDGKVCGGDGCDGICGVCPGLQDECIAGACVCIPDCDGKVCGEDGCGGSCGACNDPNQGCHMGDCKPYKGSWIILDEKEIVYKGIYYLLLKVGFKSDMSTADNWCYEYTDLCESYGYVPTGCGDDFPNGGYGECKTKYMSDGTSNSLGCNPSGGISNAAQQSGYGDANSANSFGFHSCGGSCQKQMCSGQHCNSALSYIDMTKEHGYTLCLMCKPDCAGKVCGDDGCGGSCGSCQGQQEICQAGLCVCQPDCDGKICGEDGCGGSCGGCEGKVCGGDGCGGTCGACPNPQEECQEGACVCIADCAGKFCGDDGCGGSCGNCQIEGESCWSGQCKPSVGSFAVLEAKDITYKEIPYLLLKVGLLSDQSVSDNWCYEYLNLCQSFGPGEGYHPTGCGDDFPNGGYGECKSKYKSDGTSNSLGCNPSGGISNAAQQNGFGDATSTNSFGFHSCGGSCQQTMCTGNHCNSAISYIDMGQPHGYTLCIK